jgi:hypothetical protein
MEYHQQLCIQIQHMDKYKVCIGTAIHVSACNSKGICPNTQSSGTCMEALVMQPPFPEQDILCYQVHACTLDSDYEPLACIQNTEYVHWSTAPTHAKIMLKTSMLIQLALQGICSYVQHNEPQQMLRVAPPERICGATDNAENEKKKKICSVCIQTLTCNCYL